MKPIINMRETTEKDTEFLREIFYEAIFVPEGEEKPDFSIVDDPALQKYTYHWMLPTDMGVIAEMDGEPVGMLWTRIFPEKDKGYGFLDEHTPEISMAVKPERRGRGIGKALLTKGLNLLRKQGHEKVSLSVSKENRSAVALYLSQDFAIAKENQTDYVMVKDLKDNQGWK